MNPDAPTELDLSVLTGFQGVKRRQENLFSVENLEVFEDFGHHPTAIKQTLESFRARFPGYKITACFEPRSNTARRAILQADFTDALAKANAVLIAPVDRIGKLDTHERFDAVAVANTLCERGVVAKSFESHEALLQGLKEALSNVHAEPELVCFFSNGSFGGIMPLLVNYVEQSFSTA